MTATEKNSILARRVASRIGVSITEAHAAVLRRAERTLARWADRECGDGSNYHIERDEDSGIPYEYHRTPDGQIRCVGKARDLEAGALRRVSDVCQAYNLTFYHQGDPRGCLLYVGDHFMTDSNYNSVGVPCSV